MDGDGRIRRLTGQDIPVAGEVLGRAFADEPIFRAVMDEPEQSTRFCSDVFTANLRHAVAFGEAWVVAAPGGRLLGVAYTTLKPEAELTADEQEEFGFSQVMARWGHLLARIGALEDEAIRAIGDLGPTWRYLAAIGIDPPFQGKGFGGSLLRHIVQRARDAGEPLALITDREANVTFYERAGFRTVASGHNSDAGMSHWSMVLTNP